MSPTMMDDGPPDRRRRARMVRDQLAECPNPRVVAAMAAVPRQVFLPLELRSAAYDDSARAIGSGQTISQPRIVAAMLSALRPVVGERALDIGAGSGYVSVLLAELVGPTGKVIAVERQASLVGETRRRLAHLAPAIELRHGDGFAGAPDVAPFDLIHIACACAVEPNNLAGQLADGGRLIAPVGPHEGIQRLWLVERRGNHLVQQWLAEVVFVPGLPGVVAL